MKTVLRSVSAGFALASSFTHAALAGGMSYGPDPVVEDGGSDAGILLLVGIAALMVIRSVVKPATSDAPTDPETKE